jgi:hypothetical protein
MGHLVLNVVLYPVVESLIGFATVHVTPGHPCILPSAVGISTGFLVPNVFWYPVAETPTGLQLKTWVIHDIIPPL